MSGGTSSESGRTSTVNLVRTSHPWTTADNAAGFALRYLAPMRRQLTAMLGAPTEADEALKLLIGHLVNAGFGDQKGGRLRDFLLRGVRSAAKARVENVPADQRPELDLDSVQLESERWVRYWREGLLERAWRAIERQQHSEPDEPVFTVLHYATANRGSSPQELATVIATETGMEMSAARVHDILPIARATFAQLVADEVAETLESPCGDDVKREIGLLGLGKAFNGVTVADGS